MTLFSPDAFQQRRAPTPWRHRVAARSRLRASNLIEVFLAIAIIAILISLLVPAASAFQRQARNSKCAHNMRQQHAAAMAFASDKGVLPRSVDNGIIFFREVAPYLGYDAAKTAKDYPIFMCPERTLADLNQLVATKGGSISYGGYTYNPYVCGIPPNSLPVKRLTQFAKPSNVWMIADGNAQAAPYIWDAGTIENRVAYDHQVGSARKAQLLMLDGHAEFKSVEEMKANEGNFWQDPRIAE